MTVGRNEVTPPYKITFRIIFIIVRTLTWGETMETITFTADLERNIRMMQELFRNDDTLIIRRAIGQNGLRCVLFFFDGMVNSLARALCGRSCAVGSRGFPPIYSLPLCSRPTNAAWKPI